MFPKQMEIQGKTSGGIVMESVLSHTMEWSCFLCILFGYLLGFATGVIGLVIPEWLRERRNRRLNKVEGS